MDRTIKTNSKPFSGTGTYPMGDTGACCRSSSSFLKFPVHISVPIVAGVGGVAYTSSFDPYDLEYAQYLVEDAASFLVLEPGVELEFNIVRFFRIAIGGYYRLTSGVRFSDPRILQEPIPANVLEGFSGGITLKFGKF